MRKPKLTTLRWRLPSRLRKQHLEELLAKGELSETLNLDFIKGVESRRDLLEARQFRFLAWQLPIFLLLAFSLLHVEIEANVLGLTVKSAQHLREVLLTLSTSLGLIGFGTNAAISNLKEILQAVAKKHSGGDLGLKEFLEVRYGLSEISPLSTFSKDLNPSAGQFILFAIFVASALSLIIMFLFIVLGVQFLNLVEIYKNPNFSHEASLFVLVYVILGDIVTLTQWILIKSFQPYRTYEDLRKLNRLENHDRKTYDAIIQQMVQRHRAKGFFGRTFGRPKLHKLP